MEDCGIIATNRHRAHLDQKAGEDYMFIGISETVLHLGRFLHLKCLFMDPSTVEVEGRVVSY